MLPTKQNILSFGSMLLHHFPRAFRILTFALVMDLQPKLARER